MTIQDFKASLSAEDIQAIKATAAKSKDITAEDKETFINYINKSSNALGDDQIAEPIRYIIASMGGLRIEDLQYLIGEEFDSEIFEQWNNMLETPILTYRDLPGGTHLYDVAPQMRVLLREQLGESNFKSCASDIGYYLYEQKKAGDIIRDTQTMHLLLDGGEAAAAAEYLSLAEGNQLVMAVKVLGNGLKDAPGYVKETIWDMTRAQGEKVDIVKILMIMLNDCVALIGNPELQKPYISRLHDTIQQLIAAGNIDITILLGIAKLRLTQNARYRRQEEEAQKTFIEAMNYLMPPLQQADPATITLAQINQYWLCLKICQEMAQPKAMTLFFEQIIKVEKAQSQDENRSEEERGRIAEAIIGQHIDMSKTYYAMPSQMQEQFTNYSEPTIALLNAFLQNNGVKHNEDITDLNDMAQLAGYYQTLGELSLHLERFDESYDALTEAQIIQMRQVAAFQKAEGDNTMSQQQLFARLALSATNHMIATHYRRQGKSQHDLGIILRSNMNLAEDCFKYYCQDGRVIHFLINAALELGDYQHNTRGFLAECGTYEKVIREFPKLNNMRFDQQLAIDLAMIHTKCGNIQADNSIRRYKDALRNLETAKSIWKTLADNTKNEQFAKNLDAVQQLIMSIKK